jgi:hypothetical protein
MTSIKPVAIHTTCVSEALNSSLMAGIELARSLRSAGEPGDGGSRLADGVSRGAEEIVALSDQLGEANFQAEVLSLSASEDSVVDVHRGWGQHGDGKLDTFRQVANVVGTVPVLRLPYSGVPLPPPHARESRSDKVSVSAALRL